LVEFDKDKLDELLRLLGSVPKIKEVKQLSKRLQKEKQKLVPKQKPIKDEISIRQRKQIANQKRSAKQKRNFRFARQIRNFFPEMSILEIRREIAKRKKGKRSSIPEAAFQNPSPEPVV